MCARRFLGVIVFLTLLVVAASFAIYQWGSNVLVRQATPDGHFEASAAGDEPDYTKPAGWLARPGLPDNPSLWLPRGAAAPLASGEAAVFYVHPTTYLDRAQWNGPIETDAATSLRTKLIVQSQASAFAPAGDVWAPRYRQAAYAAFLLNNRDAAQALDFAYRDIAKAFDQFLREAGQRPIVLAGHSQGALHLLRLLGERRNELKGRLVAGYVVGWPVSTIADLPTLPVPACQSPDESNCLLSWLTFAEPANPNLILDEWKTGRGPSGKPHRAEDLLCVNPLTGTRGGSAPPAANPGTIVPTASLQSATLVTGQVGASCKDGLLIVDGAMPSLGSLVLPGNNYHVYDITLFWSAIRQDAVRRLAAWQAR